LPATETKKARASVRGSPVGLQHSSVDAALDRILYVGLQAGAQCGGVSPDGRPMRGCTDTKDPSSPFLGNATPSSSITAGVVSRSHSSPLPGRTADGPRSKISGTRSRPRLNTHRATPTLRLATIVDGLASSYTPTKLAGTRVTADQVYIRVRCNRSSSTDTGHFGGRRRMHRKK
jgi:hypothetical protein